MVDFLVNERIRVKLETPDCGHPALEHYLKYPPEGVDYIGVAASIDGKGYISKNSSSKEQGFKALVKKAFCIPNAKRIENTDADLVHATDGQLLLTSKPWFTDCEAEGAFYRFSYNGAGTGVSKGIINSVLRGKRCKGIFAWSEAARTSMVKSLGEWAREKTRVVYPTTAPKKDHASEPGEIFRFLFVGRNFFCKGGLEVLQAFREIVGKVDAELHLVCDAPKEIVDEYSKVKGIKFHSFPMQKDTLYGEIYPKAHCLVFPSYIDTYGFVAVEALSFGIPVIATRTYALPELLEEVEEELLLESPLKWHGENLSFDLKAHQSMEEFERKCRIEKPIFVDLSFANSNNPN